MAKGVSLHIGVNQVNHAVYQGLQQDLQGCVNDAKAMHGIALAQGFAADILVDGQATREAVVSSILRAQDLEEGDFFLLTFSGHGSLVDDKNGDELNGQDETWCLYDQQLIDDELYALLADFREDIRVLVIADCCYSGNTESPELAPVADGFLAAESALEEERERMFRVLPASVAATMRRRDGEFYEELQGRVPRGRQIGLRASVLYLAACDELQLAEDQPQNGVFTETLLRVWDGGGFAGNYHRFHEAILHTIPNDQFPILRALSTDGVQFAAQAAKPFLI